MSRRNLICLVIILMATNVFALRVSRPPVLSNPIEEDQISQLNKFLEDMWLMQYGRFELDIVTTTKTDAKNGEIWILNAGGDSYKLQYKAGDAVHTITPD